LKDEQYTNLYNFNYRRLRLWKVRHQDAADIAQIHCIKIILENKKQTLMQTYIDYSRKNYGDYRVSYLQQDDCRINYQTPLDDLIKKRDFQRNIEMMNHKEKCLIRNLLFLKKRSSIARRMQVSAARISQLIVELLSKIKSGPMI
jgi:DNA-directed RNA polymerase specialized sigma subunit